MKPNRHPSARRRTPRLAAATALAFALAASLASASVAQPPPSFLVERIVVTGATSEAARRIVVAESRLLEGSSYAEPELRDAVHRVKRLPFVLDADMALQKGSAPGAYELEISIEMVKPVAFGLELRGYGHERNGYDHGDRFSRLGTGTVSARRFVGSRGLLFGSAQGYDQGDAAFLQLGYTQYDVLRPGGYATVAASRAVGSGAGDEDLQISSQLYLPLVGNHALRASLSRTESRSDWSLLDGTRRRSRLEAWEGGIDWIHDTTDDPIFPRTGSLLTAGVGYGRTVTTERGRLGLPGFIVNSFDQRHWQARGEGRHYWELTPHQSLGVVATSAHDESRSGFQSVHPRTDLLGLSALHAIGPWESWRLGRIGDLRFETSLGLQRHASEQTYLGNRFDGHSWSATLGAALAFRSSWGIVRVGATYVDSRGEGF
jgi:hypothetical protein